MNGATDMTDSVSEKRVQFAELLGREDHLGLEGVEPFEIVVDRQHGTDALLDDHLRVVTVSPTDICIFESTVGIVSNLSGSIIMVLSRTPGAAGTARSSVRLRPDIRNLG